MVFLSEMNSAFSRMMYGCVPPTKEDEDTNTMLLYIKGYSTCVHLSNVLFRDCMATWNLVLISALRYNMKFRALHDFADHPLPTMQDYRAHGPKSQDFACETDSPGNAPFKSLHTVG